ncbi:MAG: hypothetical protein GXP49_04385 [Deltaproteobacteria bacterium]|nr:hypothetical protein [Deltaproteobacteria bacterium]
MTRTLSHGLNAYLFLPAALAVALSAMSCAPDINLQEPAAPHPVALFDPTTGEIPFPNVVLQNPSNEQLALPKMPPPGGLASCARDDVVCDNECKLGEAEDPCSSAKTVYDGPLTLELKDEMNRLNGFLDSSTITIPFSKPLDPDTITDDTVMFMNINPVFLQHKGPEVIPAGEQHDSGKQVGSGYWRIYSSDPSPSLVIKNKADVDSLGLPAPLAAGGHYAVAITKDVRGEDGSPIEPDLLTYLLESRKPLVDSAKGRILNFLLESEVQAGQMTMDDVISLEKLRKNCDNIFTAMEGEMNIKREDLALFFFFGIVPNPQPRFGPKLGATMTFPEGMNPYPNEYTGTEQPVPGDQAIKIYFNPVPIDVLFESDSFIRLFDITSGTPVRKAANIQKPPKNEGNYFVELRMGLDGKQNFESGHRYAVVVTTPMSGFNTVQGTSYWGLVSAENPLVDQDGNPLSQLLDSRLDVLVMLASSGLIKHTPTEATQDDWKLATNMLKQTLAGLEGVRQRMKPVLDALEKADSTLSRKNISLVSTFTVQ